MADEIRLQSFQRGPPTGRILQVEALYHSDSNQHIVFWDDILEAFPGATSVLNGTVVVTRARDAAFRFIEPRCIKYQAGKLLEVIGGEDLGTLGGSAFTPTPLPEMLTLRSIEQWAAMITPEETLLGGRYAPTICTLTTTKSRPFKPLVVPTETDASSMRDDSATASEVEDEHDDDREVTQEVEQEQEQEQVAEQELTGLANELPLATTIVDMPNGYKTTGNRPSIPLYSPLPPGQSDFSVIYAPPPPPVITETDTAINPEYEYWPVSDNSSTAAINPYNNDNNIFSGDISGRGFMSSTSPSSISTTFISLAQPPPPLAPGARAPKKPGFLKSVLSGFSTSWRTLAKPVSTEAASQGPSFYTQYPLLPQGPLAGEKDPYVFKPASSSPMQGEIAGGQDEEEDEVDLVELYRKVEEERIVSWDDILELFPSAIGVLNGSVVVSRARDAQFRFIEPRCFRHQSEMVLEVVFAVDLTLAHPAVSGSSTSTTTTAVTAVTVEDVLHPQNLAYQDIEQWVKTSAENILPGGTYTPPISSLASDTTDHPFKPLYVPTEADAKSVTSSLPTQQPKRIVMPSVEFDAAVAKIKTLFTTPGSNDILELYALFKRATVGDNDTSRPGFTEFNGRAKWDTWAGKKGIPKKDAEAQYIALVTKLTAQTISRRII